MNSNRVAYWGPISSPGPCNQQGGGGLGLILPQISMNSEGGGGVFYPKTSKGVLSYSTLSLHGRYII